MGRFLSGNEAIARGAYEAGARVASGYPGTPSTEILEAIARWGEIYAEWSTNEKVAYEVALGAAWGGARGLVAMKHVGLNVAADPFMTSAYTGVGAGLVVCCCDDPGAHSSQNEQDTRIFCKFAGVPALEPSDSQEAKDFTIRAFEISEEFDLPVVLRSTTRVSHSKGVVELGARRDAPSAPFKKDPAKLVMLPSYARKRHAALLSKLERLSCFAETCDLNRVEAGEGRVGVITSGISYQYVKEVAPWADIFKLGLIYPLPKERLAEFASRYNGVIAVEELEPFIEEELKAMGLKARGKDLFPRAGELSPGFVAEGFRRADLLAPRRDASEPLQTVSRPPVLCAGCPHTPVFVALRALKATVMGDIGCYTLGALKPLDAMDSCLCMGASIGTAMGLALSGGAGRKVVAAIGDSTFFHAGIPALINAVYNKSPITILIMNNWVTAMTGGQDHPGTGLQLSGERTRAIDLFELCKAAGAEDIELVDPYDYEACFQSIKRALESDKLSVRITTRPCVLAPCQIKERPYCVDPSLCNACEICLKIGCPAIVQADESHKKKKKAAITAEACTGCSICAQLCPVAAIRLIEER